MLSQELQTDSTHRTNDKAGGLLACLTRQSFSMYSLPPFSPLYFILRGINNHYTSFHTHEESTTKHRPVAASHLHLHPGNAALRCHGIMIGSSTTSIREEIHKPLSRNFVIGPTPAAMTTKCSGECFVFFTVGYHRFGQDRLIHEVTRRST